MDEEEDEQGYYLQNGYSKHPRDDDPNYPHQDHCRMDRRRTSYAYRAVLAVENVARRMSVPAFTMDTIAEDLDEEIERDAEEPQGIVQMLRRSGEQILHSKKVLLLIVVLNIIDCALVLGELILDIHFIKEMVHDARTLTMTFTGLLLDLFPAMFYGLNMQEVAKVFNRVIYVVSASNQTTEPYLNFSMENNVTYSYTSRPHAEMAGNDVVYFTPSDIPAFIDHEHTKTLIEKLAYGFHKASMTILGILVVLTLLKIFCYGLTMFKKKFELFDGFIVMTSFALDIYFIKGMMGYPLEEAVATLAFLIPWRVIRVANSLVMAVMDEAHLQLKLVYTEKKTIEDKLDEANSNLRYQKKVNQILRTLCVDEGIPMSKISEKTAGCGIPLFRVKKKKRHFKSLKKRLNCLMKAGSCNSLSSDHHTIHVPHHYFHSRRATSSESSSSQGTSTPDDDISKNASMVSIPDAIPEVIPKQIPKDVLGAENITYSSNVVPNEENNLQDKNNLLENDNSIDLAQKTNHCHSSPGRYRKAHNHVTRNV